MTPDVKTAFLTYYIRSLAERKRVEKTSTKFGFDWVIYNLALADNLTPYRLPFFRSGPTEISKTKTETEFGIDSSFLSQDRKALTIYVLKDEELSNANWTKHSFDGDLRRASAPDLSPVEFRDVREVRVVLAYNKDEDQAGIQLYTNLIKSLGTKVGDDVTLAFERWNLTVLVEQVQGKLLTPSFLPQKFFSLFSYICAQFGDFRHGSDEWANQLIPNWRRFIDDLLKENADERSVRLLPVALIILREHGTSNPNAETGWIDLAEWAMLAVWRVHESTERKEIKQAVLQMWVGFYVANLERYYLQHANEFAIEHSLEVFGAGNYVDAVASAVITYWHIARLGILALSYAELIPETTPKQQAGKLELARRVANQLVSLLNANPAANRPLLDINHIELFLIWRSLWQLGRLHDIYKWLQSLRSYLLVRRAGTASFPFIEGYNNLDLVFEFVATNEKPPEFCDQSSMLLLCILEFCFSLEPTQRDELIALYYREIVLGQDSYGAQMKDRTPIDLMGWFPPEDWAKKVFTKCLSDEGESQTVEFFESPSGKDGSAIAVKLETFIKQSRTTRKTELPEHVPISAVILACLKHRSPLPAEIWRRSIFDDRKETQ